MSVGTGCLGKLAFPWGVLDWVNYHWFEKLVHFRDPNFPQILQQSCQMPIPRFRSRSCLQYKSFRVEGTGMRISLGKGVLFRKDLPAFVWGPVQCKEAAKSLEKSVAKDGFPGYAWATWLVTAGHRCKDHRFSVSRGSWEGSYTKPPLSRRREGICWLPYNPRKWPPLDHPAVTRVNCPVLLHFPKCSWEGHLGWWVGEGAAAVCLLQFVKYQLLEHVLALRYKKVHGTQIQKGIISIF